MDRVFPVTGLASENKSWAGDGWFLDPGQDPDPMVFTEELCEWAMKVFYKSTHSSPRERHPSFIRPRELAAPLVDEIGVQDNSYPRHPLQSLARSLSVVINNHLTDAAIRHTAIYLRAKYADRRLTSDHEGGQPVGQGHRSTPRLRPYPRNLSPRLFFLAFFCSGQTHNLTS